MKRFEDLLVWKKAQQLFVELNAIFGKTNHFFIKDQILRAGLSISNNIAEGFERRSNKEFAYFLYIAKGSSGEVRSMIYISYEMKILNEEKKQKFISQTEEISKMISGLIQSVNKQI
ncbi:MAG: four helix bundle protein [Verrucomicrobia bacterium]|nr:four helix bundle protein [Verrucomicrobiota bacterium]|tara:strand:+ start:550 stop:900 length:351 start_codon:yes stop_codon:yes gene_type:complete